jgi:hypothetical protein
MHVRFPVQPVQSAGPVDAEKRFYERTGKKPLNREKTGKKPLNRLGRAVLRFRLFFFFFLFQYGLFFYLEKF